MSLWRYKAVPARDPSGPPVAGELTADSAALARASLRRAGLHQLELSRVRQRGSARLGPFADSFHRHLRERRRPIKAELYDATATMLGAGIALPDALASLQTSTRKSQRILLADLAARLRGGEDLDGAMKHHSGWFEPAEIAMVRAGQRSGELLSIVRSLAEREERAGNLANKLVGALLYPAILACVGVGVTLFLSSSTLPQLTAILVDAEVEVPRLTATVMALGQGVVHLWWLALGVLAITLVVFLSTPSLLARYAPTVDLPMPRVLRDVFLARAMIGLAELIAAGIPLVEALRVVAPTLGGPGAATLRAALTRAATSIERGATVRDALDDPRWFSPEVQQLIHVGETAGELDEVLPKIGARALRRAERATDRLSALLEPAVILVLAALIGVIIMASILPLIRLQEIV